ncbi:MAG: MATE family efflux transporter [Tannerella sp.]|jgi:putative MATE family efflux protein|nr:MATE family efflux transporter [Tannerella sp.]
MNSNNNHSSSLKLGTAPVGRLLTGYAIPAIIAMTASSVYNMVDSIIIGHGVGTMAIAGLALTFPLMNLAAAFGSFVGVGASTIISVKMGQRDYESANQALGNVLVLNIVIGIAFTALCFPFLDSVFRFFGASDRTLVHAREYMEVILIGNVVTHIYFGLNAVLRAAGHPKLAMYTTLTSVVVNCILAPLFVFGFGWGIRGAAWATVIAQLISLAWQIVHFLRPDQLLHFRKGIYGLKRKLVSRIFAIGLSPFLMNLCSCLIVILINRGLKTCGGDLTIGAYGIINRIIFLFAMVIMGLNQGMQPVAGYNFGARDYRRVTQVTNLTIGWGMGIATFGFLICHLFPATIIGWFTSDAELIRTATYGLHIVFAVFPLAGFQMVATNFFLSVGMSGKAIFLSLTRQALFMIPCLIVLPQFFGVLGVWISLPVADFTASALTAFMLFRELGKLKRTTRESLRYGK